ncbi:MAG: recombinase family protein [Acidobacteriota bacterium]
MEMDSTANTRYAIYARFSSDLSHRASIEDQVSACTAAIADRFAEWELAEGATFTDVSISGSRSSERPGFTALLEKAQEKAKPFDYVVMTDTDRLGRNLADVLECVETLDLYGIRVFFVNQMLDSAHPGFRMVLSVIDRVDREFVKALSQKIQRAMKGRVLQGLSTGGRCFGYCSVPLWSEEGSLIGTTVTINPAEASIVKRIYTAYAEGASARAIAQTLNADRVPSPRGSRLPTGENPHWKAHHICTILRRERYKGNVVWGCTQTVVNPQTGKINRIPAPKDEVIHIVAPHLAIVDANLAKAVDERLEANGKQRA